MASATHSQAGRDTRTPTTITNSPPILELTQLQPISNIIPANPNVLNSLRMVRSRLTIRVHPTKSAFFQSVVDPSKIFIFGFWPTVKSHLDFLDSTGFEGREEVLAPQEGLLDFVKGNHWSRVKHPLDTSDPSQGPSDSYDSVQGVKWMVVAEIPSDTSKERWREYAMLAVTSELKKALWWKGVDEGNSRKILSLTFWASKELALLALARLGGRREPNSTAGSDANQSRETYNAQLLCNMELIARRE